MSAQDILMLIEAADPKNSEQLDEIDARVDCLLKPRTFEGYEAKYNSEGEHSYVLKGTLLLHCPHYTRSRDALKEIRPKGWLLLHAEQYVDGWNFKFDKNGVTRKSLNDGLPTEELAELHAIIQTIEYERTSKNEITPSP